MQKALIHWCDSICFHFDAASVYKSNAACVRQSTRDKNNWIRLLDAQSSDLKKKKEKAFNKLQNTPNQKRREKNQQKPEAFWNEVMLFASWRNRHEFFIKKIQLYWSSCTALYLFFTFDLPFSVSSRHHERKPCGVLLEVGLLLSPLVNLSSCWSQWQGWLQIWYTGWERDYGSVPSAGRQKIQAVQDFLDIRKRFHEICKDLTVYCRFHVV